MKRQTEKARKIRQEERKHFPEFYKKHINKIVNEKICCQECGVRLIGSVSEVAHILNKSYFKSISTEDTNIIYLCGQHQNNCHSKFDNSSNSDMRAMNIFPSVNISFNNLKDLLTEKINYKIEDRYGD